MTEPIDFRQVQANILLPYAPGQANCARLMCFRFDPTRLSEARDWVRELSESVSYHSDVRDAQGLPRKLSGDARINVGFTWSGLEVLGFDPFVLANLPEEFREGMAERAERLGDVIAKKEYAAPVHALVMVYAYDDTVDEKSRELGADVFAWLPLSAERIGSVEFAVSQALEHPVAQLPQSPAVTHVAEYDQDTYRLTATAKGFEEIEYFGFRDGISQPRIEGVPVTPSQPDDHGTGLNKPGTVLLGYPACIDTDQRPATRLELAQKRLAHGSFLVARKLSQDVEGFHREVELLARKVPNMDGLKLAEMMVGRKQDGTPLVGARNDDFDDFDYDEDPEGVRCPFQSHVRRSHPRDEWSGFRRIMRRAMPYSGPPSKGEGKNLEKHETGLMFLAYNSDIESQFEFIQRLWINSGIENHGLSRDRDPIAGEPVAKNSPEVGKSSFTFTSPSPEDQKPYTLTGLKSFVQLRWGEYFLVPSRDTLEELSEPTDSPIREYEHVVEHVRTAARARDILGRWLDDAETSKRLWREVRERGGVVRLRRPEAVLVGKTKYAKKVLRDDGSRYSVKIQGERMKQTTGAFYLGMDANTPQYQDESAASANIIPGWKDDGEQSIEEQLEAVKLATRKLCFGFLGVSVVSALAKDLSAKPTRGKLDIKQFTAFVLSGLTPKFFGVPQPSAGGTFKMNVPASGYVFFPFPPEEFREDADAASQGIRAYLSRLFEDRDRTKANTRFPDGVELVDEKPPQPGAGGLQPDERWKQKLDEVLGKIEQASEEWSRDDHVRNMSGIISGMLIASFKLFVDGVSGYAKRTDVGEVIEAPKNPRRVARLPFDTLKGEEYSMPNVLYRLSMVRQKLGSVRVREGDFVLACQGSAMADAAERKKDQEWFYGDRTPRSNKKMKKTAPHFCPGYRMADAMLQTMSTFLFTEGISGLKDLKRVDETGELLEYDWPSAFHQIELVKKLAAASAGSESKA